MLTSVQRVPPRARIVDRDDYPGVTWTLAVYFSLLAVFVATVTDSGTLKLIGFAWTARYMSGRSKTGETAVETNRWHKAKCRSACHCRKPGQMSKCAAPYRRPLSFGFNLCCVARIPLHESRDFDRTLSQHGLGQIANYATGRAFDPRCTRLLRPTHQNPCGRRAFRSSAATKCARSLGIVGSRAQ